MSQNRKKTPTELRRELRAARRKVAALEKRLSDSTKPTSTTAFEQDPLRLLESVLNASPAVAIVWSAEEGWPVRLVSENINQYGYSSDDLISGRMDFDQLVHPEDIDRAKAEALRYREDPECDEFTQEYRILTRDGKTRWVDDRTWIRRDADRRVIGLQTILLDITNRRLAEEELRQSENKYRALVEATHTGYLILDEQGRVVDANHEYVRLTGHSELSEILGRKVTEWTAPHDIERNRREVEQCLERGAVRGLEIDYADLQGRITPILISARVVQMPEGMRILSLCSDNTERKRTEQALRESEERFREMADMLPQGVFETDLQGNLVYLNRHGLKMALATQEDLRRGLTTQQLVIPEDRPRVRARSQAVLEGGHQGGNEYTCQRLDGKTFPIVVYSSPIFRQGNPVGLRGVIIDISETKKAEHALRESEMLFRTFAENIPGVVGIYEVLPDGHRKSIYISDGLAEIIGRELTDSIGNDMDAYFTLIHPDDVDGLQAASQLAEDQQRVLTHEYRVRTQTGEYRWVRVVAWGIPQPGGAVRWEGHVFDIHETRGAQEALRRSEEQYRSLIENVHAAISVVDYDGVFRFVNSVAARHLGIPAGEAVGKTQWDFFPQDVADRQVQTVREVIDSGDEISRETMVPLAGGIRWFRTILHTFTGTVAGDTKAAMVVAYDITERKQAELALGESEARFRELTELLPLTVYEADVGGKITYANRHALNLTGYSDSDLVGGINALEMFVEEDRARASESLQGVISGRGRTGNEYNLRRKDGTLIPVLVYSSRVLKDDRVVGIRGVVVDLSEQKQAQAKDRAEFELLSNLRTATEADECLRLGCRAIADARLFERAVLTLHNEKREIVNLGQVGLDEEIVKAARSAPAPDEQLSRRMMQDEFRISNSYYIPVESGLFTGDTPRAILETTNQPHPRATWKTGDEFFIPIVGDDGDKVGWLSVDTPCDGSRPTVETARYMEGIVDIVYQRIRQLKYFEELAKREEQFRTVAEGTPIPIGIASVATGKILYANSAMMTSLGYDQNQIEQLRATDIYATAGEREKVLKMLDEKGALDKYEVTSRTADGAIQHVLISVKPIDFLGEKAIFGSVLDITEIREAEKLLLQAEQDRYDQVRRIAGGVAHEIYNALFPATSCLEKLGSRMSLVDESELERNRKLLDISGEAVRRAIAMTELVKQYSRLESERTLEMVQLRPVLDEILETHRTRIDLANVTVDLEIPDGYVLMGLRTHLHSLFNNLLINALDALDESEERRITIIASADNGRRTIEFSDTGTGIPPEDKDRVFDAFFSTKPSAGTGLGLTMVRRITELYNGRVTVVGGEGGGAKFVLSFADSQAGLTDNSA